MANNWREYLNKELRYYLERLILESFSQKKALDVAKEKGRAQLWVALALLNKRLTDIELKTNYLEKTMQRIFSKHEGPSKIERKKQEAEVKRLIKSLARGEPLTDKQKRSVKKEKKRSTIKRKEKGRFKIAKSL